MAVNGVSWGNVETPVNSLTSGNAAVQSAQYKSDQNKFMSLVQNISDEKKNAGSNVSSAQIGTSGRLNGDYTQGFHGAYTSEADKHARPEGAAANSSNGKGKQKTIDKTSKLYEEALELENYFVKEMLSSMRKTISKSNLLGSEDDYAQNTYEDMLYDNYAEELTKNSHFGLADQIYLQLDTQA
jgi:flagellar protein FlgJ